MSMVSVARTHGRAEGQPDSGVVSVFLEVNLESLRLLERTRERVRSSAPRGQMVRAHDGTALIKLGNDFLGAPYPHDELEWRLADCDPSWTVVVFGLGAGQLVRSVRARTRAPIVVYEPDPGLLRRVLEYGPLDLGDVSIVCSTEELTRAWPTKQQSLVLTTPGYSKHYPERLEECRAAVKNLVQRVTITKNTLARRSQGWVQNILDNVELLSEAPPLLALADKYRGVPAFIVGAGPSLDKNIDELRRAAEKGIVIATNSSAAALAARGIEPQILICLESIDVFERMRALPFIDRVARAISLTAAPRTLRAGEGPLLPWHEAMPQFEALSELTHAPGVTACGSVSTAAMTLAFRLGCSPIVLVGQDLAYSDGRTYAEGTGYESSRAEISSDRGVVELKWNETLLAAHGTSHGRRHDREPLVWIDAWGGQGKVSSAVSFMSVHTWFENTATLLAGLDDKVELINATEGGARIKGFAERKLGEVLAGLRDLDITSAELARVAREQRAPLSREEIACWLEAQAQRTARVRRAARRLWRLAGHALRVTRRGEPGPVARAYARLDAAENGLRRAVAEGPLVDAWANNAVEAAVQAAGEPPEADARALAEHSIQKGAAVARAVEAAATELDAHLLEATRRLRHNID